jgi:hypothetical protein
MKHDDGWFDEWKIRRGRRPRVGSIFSSSRSDKIGGSSSGGRAPQPNFRLSVSCKSRAKGESSVAAAAYRAADVLVDERTGITHDYRRKQQVEFSEIVAPAGAPSWAMDRSVLWNEAERNETKSNSRVAREWQISIPRGLNEPQAIKLARELAHEIAERHQVVVDFSIHRDNPKNFDGSEKGYISYHAHLLATTRRITLNGFSEKTRELDDKRQGPEEIKFWRVRYDALANHALEKAGIDARVDHRSYLARGIDKFPQPKLGPALTQIFRRNKTKIETSVVVDRWEEAAEIRQAQFKLASIKKEYDQAVKEAAIAEPMVGSDNYSRADSLEMVDQHVKKVAIRDGIPYDQAQRRVAILAKFIEVSRGHAAKQFPGNEKEQNRFVDAAVENVKKAAASQYPGNKAAQNRSIDEIMEGVVRRQSVKPVQGKSSERRDLGRREEKER